MQHGREHVVYRNHQTRPPVFREVNLPRKMTWKILMIMLKSDNLSHLLRSMTRMWRSIMTLRSIVLFPPGGGTRIRHRAALHAESEAGSFFLRSLSRARSRARYMPPSLPPSLPSSPPASL